MYLSCVKKTHYEHTEVSLQPQNVRVCSVHDLVCTIPAGARGDHCDGQYGGDDQSSTLRTAGSLITLLMRCNSERKAMQSTNQSASRVDSCTYGQCSQMARGQHK